MKKILSLVLALAMVLSVCSFAAAEEPVHLVWFMYTASETPIDWPEVEEALNAYSAEKIGVTVEYRYMDENQVALAMNSGEYFDIAFTCDWWNDYATNVAAGMFLNLNDYLDKYPALKDSIVEKAWEGVKVNGDIYAIPHMKDIGYEVFWILNTDYFINQKGFEVDQYISFEGIEPYFEAYKADHPDDYPFKMSYGGITSWQNALADWLNMDILIGLDWEAQGTDEETTVKSALEIPAWKNRVAKLHEWYEKGYFNPDAAVTESMPRAQAGVVQSGQGWFGAETVWANVIKQPIYISRYDGPYMSTSSIRGSMTAVSSFSEHPDEALKLIELMNTDPWYRETARYGIEGKHYTRNEDGTVTRTELGSSNMGVQAYAQGHYTVGALEASPFPEVPTDIDQWTKTMANYENATLSAAMGFTPDLSTVENENLAVKAVIEEYRRELYTGTSDPEVVIPEMLERMNEAGLQTIIAEVQAQLDAFLGK
ncbi:MAG: ABC transporter substrate-binding protein [Clostridia bacterium]|nr:ABC transporter substrate-binding protein [Clostridia bacterium]